MDSNKLTRIKNTKYLDAVSKINKPFTAAKIESALRSELAEIHYSIASTTGKSAILDAYYLKFLISNLKVIIKGKALGKTQEEIEPHLNLHAEELINQRDHLHTARERTEKTNRPWLSRSFALSLSLPPTVER